MYASHIFQNGSYTIILLSTQISEQAWMFLPGANNELCTTGFAYCGPMKWHTYVFTYTHAPANFTCTQKHTHRPWKRLVDLSWIHNLCHWPNHQLFPCATTDVPHTMYANIRKTDRHADGLGRGFINYRPDACRPWGRRNKQKTKKKLKYSLASEDWSRN